MVDSLPPLVPANVDLRSMPEMPLDVALFRDASIIDAITDQALKAAIILWCVAWHQVPAASLPDDDHALARWTGFGKHVSEWLEIKEQALWKFVKCSDGRWYHPIIAEKAIRTWEYRESYRRRTAEARAHKALKRSGNNGGGSITGSVTDVVTSSVVRRTDAKEIKRTKLGFHNTPNTKALVNRQATEKPHKNGTSVTESVTGLNQTKQNCILLQSSPSSTGPPDSAVNKSKPLLLSEAALAAINRTKS
jgi:Protein of unknown function (DUF1376)